MTNDPRRLTADVDMRSIAGRRFADLYDRIAATFPSADSGRIREIAVLRYEAERATAIDACSLADVVSALDLAGRLEKELRACK